MDPLKPRINQDPPEEKGYILLPAHILATPVISDIDGDGNYEIVVPVSYYFDANEEMSISQEIEIEKYVAGGIVVVDIASHKIKWSLHLDLTTDKSAYKAYLFSSPTVIDMNGDKKQEIIIGTGVGFVYVLNSEGGVVSPWPMMTDSISSQIVVEDINNDGNMELIVLDNKDNLICFSYTGQELWEIQIKGNNGMQVSHVRTISYFILEISLQLALFWSASFYC